MQQASFHTREDPRFLPRWQEPQASSQPASRWRGYPSFGRFAPPRREPLRLPIVSRFARATLDALVALEVVAIIAAVCVVLR